MKCLLVLHVLVLPLGLARAAPVPPDRIPPKLYHATEVGAVCRYKWSNGADFTDSVTAVERKEGVTYVTVERRDVAEGPPGVPTVTIRSVVAVSSGGVVVKDCGLGPADPGVPVRLVAVPPRRWRYDSRFRGQEGEHILTATGPEKVRVPAGEFDAVKVHEVWVQTDGGLGPRESFTWYAPGVGLVKHEFFDHYAPVVTVLTAFTPGRD